MYEKQKSSLFAQKLTDTQLVIYVTDLQPITYRYKQIDVNNLTESYKQSAVN